MDFFFIQMSDPQFGMFSRLSGMDDERIQHFRQVNGWNILSVPKSTGFAQESALYEKAIAAANRLNPAFVVISGDMVEDRSDPGQLAELRRISALLNPHIPVHWAPGNWAAVTLLEILASAASDTPRLTLPKVRWGE